jgi:hypothetical protein
MKIFRRAAKITLIVVLSVVGLAAAAMGAACYLVFTPDRLTPVAVQQLGSMLRAKVSFDTIDLTFFGTFPNFGIRLTNMSVSSHMDSALNMRSAACFGTTNPQLLRLRSCVVSVNPVAYLKNKDIIVNGIEFTDADIYAYIDSAGNANFDVMNASPAADIPDTASAQTDTASQLLRNAKLEFLKINNANIFYSDQKQKITACISGFNLAIDGEYSSGSGDGSIKISAAQISAALPDMTAAMRDFTIAANGNFTPMPVHSAAGVSKTYNGGGGVRIAASALNFSMPKMNAACSNFSVKADAEMLRNVLKTNTNLGLTLSNFIMNDTSLAQNIEVKVKVDAAFDKNNNLLTANDFGIKINDITIAANGTARTDTAFKAWDMDLDYALKIPSAAKVLAMLPEAKIPQVKNAQMHGSISIDGKAKGMLRDSTAMPLITGKLAVNLGGIRYPDLPCSVDKVSASIGYQVDLKGRQPSFANIVELKTRVDAAGAMVSVTGRADQLLGDPMLNISLKLNADLEKSKNVAHKIPSLDTLLQGMEVKGALTAQIQTRTRLSDAANARLERILVDGNVGIGDLSYSSAKDTMQASLKTLAMQIKHNPANFADIEVNINDVQAAIGAMKANMRHARISATSSDPRDSMRLPSVACTFSIEGSRLRTDSIRLRAARIGGSAALKPHHANARKPDVSLTLKTDSIRAFAFGNVISLRSGETAIDAHQLGDTTQGFKGWLARAHLNYGNVQAFAPAFPERIYLDKLQATVTEQEQRLEQCAVRIGASDFNLTGSVADLLPYLDKKKKLQTALKLTANNIDLNQLLNISEAGSKAKPATADAESPDYENQVKQNIKVDTAPPKMGAIMLPTDITASFETDIKAVTFGKMDLHNVKGGVSLADGAVILQELGVIAHKKTRMNLTAIYRTPERNHIFAGISYHLVNVQLGELQDIIPDVDTILPMLRSFEGHVDFHLVAQTYLDSNYNVKFSTLRAASSIRGDSLVVLDGETFATISKYLLFKNKKRNMIDSLSVELVVFKNQIELYPFVVSMDRYRVAVGGKHNLDMTFNYHASILESPLPKRLGVDISGTMDKPKIKLAPPRYESMFVPAKKGVVQNSQMEIREQIRKALTIPK